MSQFSLPSGTLDLQSIIKMFQEQQAKANAANESRYGDVLNLYRQGGKADRADVLRQGQEDRGGISQDLMSRGLFNSTVLDAMRRRSTEQDQRQVQRINEGVRSNVAGVMERRTDQGPNLGIFSQLIQSAAQGMGSQAGQSGQGVGRANNFLGVDPSRFSTGGGRTSSFGGGTGGGFNSPVDFGGTGGGGGGGSGVAGYTNTSNFNPSAYGGTQVGNTSIGGGLPPIFRNGPDMVVPQAPDSARIAGQQASRFFPAGTPVPQGARMDSTRSTGSIFGNYYYA